MAGCEKCWGDAFGRSRMKGTFQVDEYNKLLKENEGKCPPEEKAGQFWDEDRQCDRRFVEKEDSVAND